MTVVNGRAVEIEEHIQKNIEDAARFVGEMLGYSPSEVWKMDCFEFFRDIVRANKKLNAQLKEIEKWQKK